jgi:hypothetical protein
MIGILTAFGCLSLSYLSACSNLLTHNGELGVYAPADEKDGSTFVKGDSGWQDGAGYNSDGGNSSRSGPVDTGLAHGKGIDSGTSGPVNAGLADAGKIPTSKIKQCEPKASAVCHLGNGVTLPEDKTVDLAGNLQLFVGGATLPAGRYRLSYVDGCNIYSVLGTKSVSGKGNCALVDENGAYIADTPGTVALVPVGVISLADGYLIPAYSTYDECVAANCEPPPLDFDFAGGKLGVKSNPPSVDTASLGLVILGGESEGGRNPTFRLTRLDPCP